MNLKKSFAHVAAIPVLLAMFSCSDDWGRSDPEAGNQVYPTREVVATYPFEYEEGSEFNDIAQLQGTQGEDYALVYDEQRKTNTLWLKDEALAILDNPLNNVKLQNGAAITFWFKGDSTTVRKGTIFFSMEDGNKFFAIREDGAIIYNVDSESSALQNFGSVWPEDSIHDGNWHFIAVQVRNDGYDLYLDGTQYKSVTSDDEIYAELVQHLQSAPTANFRSADSQTYYDDITFIRNQMIENDWNKKFTPSQSTEEEEVIDWIIVGETDFSSGWWSAFSDNWDLSDGQTLHLGFYNYNSGTGNNWNNWLIVCTNGGYSAAVPDKGGTGAEHFVLRADAFGWGDGNYDGGKISSNFNWDTYVSDMNGSWVDMTISKNSGVITMHADITCENGTEYDYDFTYEGATEEKTGICLTVENAYLTLDPKEVYYGTIYSSGSMVVGATDFTTGWWSAFSEAYTFSGDIDEECPFVAHFINNTSGESQNIWNNWLVIFTSGGYCSNMPGVTGDGSEYAVFRADAGWWSLIGAEGSVDFTYDANTWVQEMSGAECWVALSRTGTATKVRFKMKKGDGSGWFNDGTFNVTLPEGTLSAIFSVELASLDFHDAAYYPYFSKIHAE